MSEPSFDVDGFEALGARGLYAVLALRAAVFVVEQACAYLDPDGRDDGALHVRAHEDGVLVAYARVLPPGARFDEPSIGRVIVAPSHRGRGVSRALMARAIAACEAAHGARPIALSAQAHLAPLYASLGFRVRGAPYDEDGIPHVEMVRACRPTGHPTPEPSPDQNDTDHGRRERSKVP